MLNIGGNPLWKKLPNILYSLLGKYVGLYLYHIDIESRYTIDYEDIQFINKYEYSLIGNPENPNGTSSDHKYFLIRDYMFDRISETDQNSYIVLKVINRDVSLP